MPTDRSLLGARAAVTGGAHGIGRAIALHLARAGARVAVGDVDLDAAEAVLRELGGDDFAFELDVADHGRFEAFLDEAGERHGPLSIMVNNAGVDWIGPFHEEPDEVTRHEIAVNLYGTTIGSKLALARMLPRREGHIVNVASAAGRVPLPGTATYAATKHGVVGLTESLRLEYRGSGLAFTVVQPAQVDTAMMEGHYPWLSRTMSPRQCSTRYVAGGSRSGCRARRPPPASSRPSCPGQDARRSSARSALTESPGRPIRVRAVPTIAVPSGASETTTA
jgi:NAD(P)-dependent dehydrogenase (short-subunit alcohol dehydrogenase family)